MENLDFKKFKEKLVVHLNEIIKDNQHIKFRKITRVNEGEMDDFIIVTLSDSSASYYSSPLFNLQVLYNLYKEDNDFSKIKELILEKCKSADEHPITYNAEKDFNMVADKIYFRIINTQLNVSLLEDIPHKPFYDLSIIYYYINSSDEEGMTSILINNQMLSNWGVSVDEIDTLAKVNTPKLLPAEIYSSSILFLKFALRIKDDSDSLFQSILMQEKFSWEKDLEDGNPIWITNTYWKSGFSVILYDGLLAKIAEHCESDLLILPCSIHEAIIMPTTKPTEDINVKDHLPPNTDTSDSPDKDFISHHIYRYYRDTDETQIV